MMDHATALALLDDYVDGELSPEARRALEAHLAACSSCRATLDELRALLAMAAALPTDIQPERDLWAGIAEQVAAPAAHAAHAVPIGPPVHPWYTQPRVLAMAAALLVGATALIASQLDTPHSPSLVVQEQPMAPEAPAPTGSPLWEQDMTTASASLALTLDARRADLQPGTLIIIDENLKIIDRAIEDCRLALERDPANTRAEDALLQVWRHKVDLLETATGLPSNS